MRPNLGDLIILKPPEDGGIFLLLSIFFSCYIFLTVRLYREEYPREPASVPGCDNPPRLDTSYDDISQELTHKKTILCFCSELTMRTFAGLRTLCSAGAEMLRKIILIWIKEDALNASNLFKEH